MDFFKKKNRNVLRKWFDFTLSIVCYLDTSIIRFEFNSFLIYVHMVEPQSCVQNVHMGGISPQQTNKQTVREKNHNELRKKNPLSKWNFTAGESKAGSEAEKYVIYSNSNQLLNVNANRLGSFKKKSTDNENGNKNIVETDLFECLCWTCATNNQRIGFKSVLNSKQMQISKSINMWNDEMNSISKTLWSAWSENENRNNREA